MIKFESVFLSRQEKDIFSGLDLFIPEKEKILIQGKSGIGKTTLFKLLLGFEKIDKGEIFFNGDRIDKLHILKIRKQIFYLSQDIDLKDGVVNRLVDEILEINKIKTSTNKKLKGLLNFLDLDNKTLKQNLKELSGGERQRTGLLIGFLLDRPVWLLDEPTSALDDIMKAKVVDFILDQDKTIVIISHDNVWKKNKKIKTIRW